MDLILDMDLAKYLLKVLNEHDWIDDTTYEQDCNLEIQERLKQIIKEDQ